MENIKIRRVDFYPNDWLEGTIALTHEERSVYITICAAIYAIGGPAELKHVRRFCPGHGFKRAFDGLVAKGKVEPIRTENGLKVDQKRTQTELKVARKRTEQARENGAKGGRPNGLDKPGGLHPTRARVPSTSTSLRKNPSSSVGEVAARARSPNGGATHAHDDENGAWKTVGNVFPLANTPVPPTPDKVKRAGEHYFFLLNQRPGEAERYLDSLDPKSQLPPDEIFNAVEARMSA